MNQLDKMDLLQTLTEGFSNQARASNKYWVLLITVSVISILNYNNPSEIIDLPFNIGKVNPTDFHSFVLMMICALSIAFASAWLQQLKTMNLIHRYINNIPEENKFLLNIHVKDFFDSIASQTFNRVSPIAQALQGKYQFYGDPKKQRHKYFSIFTYVVLKTITSFIIFLIPMLALYKSAQYFTIHGVGTTWNIPVLFYWAMIFVSFFVFLIMIISDISYVLNNCKRILKS